MLPKQYRLTKNRDIRRVMQKGRKLSVPDVRLQYLIGNKLNHPRITVLVSTKINKSAVKRNLLKRRIKSLLIEYINSNQTSVDVVITPFRELEYSKIAPAIKELLSKVS
jgi:ribonuclease P protein component